jgi:hypothetical protein
MSNFYKNIAWAVLTLVLISFVFSLFLTPGTEPEKITLNQLAERVNAGQVKRIEVSGNQLDVTLENDSHAL